jgi:UDP-N-acetylglucosamine--N-acetylmuramyl-(pentapeptide) pyrophosphoryl-undecaprenol N-acetylglucosamine transferase
LPGLTNRLLARVVRSAAITYDSTRRFFGPKAFVSGNPIRPEFFEAREEPNEQSTTAGTTATTGILIVGGSQGAHAINVAMVEAAGRLAAADRGIHVVHQTGERDAEMVRAAYRDARLSSEVEPFLFDMADRFRAADVVICRAGQTTLSELAAIGRPAILIPLPTAADDHQRRNAEAMAAAGAAEVVLQRDLTGALLAERVVSLAGDAGRRARMKAAARALARPDAARVIVDRALALMGRSG